MKKLISLLLVLTMVLGLLGVGVSAFADDEAPVEAPVEEPVEEPAAEEAPVEEAPVEEAAAEEDPVEEAPAVEATEPVSDGKASSPLSAGTYVLVYNDTKAIGVDESGNIIPVAVDPGAVNGKDAASIASNAQWVADGSGGLTNGSYNLYCDYKGGTYKLTTRAETAASWNFITTDGTTGTMAYDASGSKYYVSAFNDDSISIASTADDPASAITLSAVQLSASSGSSDSSSKSDSSSSSSSSSVTYTKISSFDELSTYVALVVDDDSVYTTFGTANGNMIIEAANVDGDSMTVGADNYLTLSFRNEEQTGFDLYKEDPPGSYSYVYVKDGAIAKSKTQPEGYWFVKGNVLGWTDGSGNDQYLTHAAETSLTFGSAPDTAKIMFYTGSDKPAKGSSGGGSSSASEVETVTANGPQISVQPVVSKYVTIGTNYEAPKYSVTAYLPESSTATAITFDWYVDDTTTPAKTITMDAKPGVEVTCEFTAESLAGLTEAGLHRVYVTCSCTMSVKGTDTTYSNTSTKVSFIVCNGLIANSELTFSDVHEIFSNIGNAISDIMTANEGKIPALVVCTGDWANGHYLNKPASVLEYGDENLTASELSNQETTYYSYIQVMAAQVGGIDIVYVAGNHDNAEAATQATKESGLYDEKYFDIQCEDRVDSEGVIYTYKNATYEAAEGEEIEHVYDYGINYNDIVVGNATDGYTYGYSNVLDSVAKFLADVAAKDPGAIVIFHTHAGMHVLGDQPESTANPWAGDNDYNLNDSDQMVNLLNSYGDQLTIFFFFGHNHSKGDSEFVLTPGDTITACVDYTEGTEAVIPLKFTYGHAGYITSSIGGKERYTFLTWDDESVTRTLYTVGGEKNEELTVTVDRTPEAPSKDYTGFVEVNDNQYYFEKGELVEDAFITVEGKTMVTNLMGAVVYNVDESETGTTLTDTEGNPVTGFVVLAGDTYYFDPETGAMQYGWQEIEGDTYYFDPETGVMASDEFLDSEDGSTYYFAEDGKMAYGEFVETADGSIYYFDADGAMQYGWIWADDGFYYLNTRTGELVTGWLYYNNGWYYLDPAENGMMANDEVLPIDGSYYYFQDGGKMASGGWVWCDGSFYYLQNNGRAVADSWLWYAGHWYYMQDDATMASNTVVQVGDDYYGFASDGKMLSDAWIWADGGFYYFQSNGRAVVDGWIWYNGSFYYFYGPKTTDAYEVYGQMVTVDEISYAGQTYGFGEDGQMLHSGWYSWTETDMSYFYSDGTEAANITIDDCTIGADGHYIVPAAPAEPAGDSSASSEPAAA